MKCPDCQDTRSIFQLKLISTNRGEDETFPKYIPQIKQSCFKCGRYIKFAVQGSELIAEFNKQLETVAVEL